MKKRNSKGRKDRKKAKETQRSEGSTNRGRETKTRRVEEERTLGKKGQKYT